MSPPGGGTRCPGSGLSRKGGKAQTIGYRLRVLTVLRLAALQRLRLII